MAIKYFHTKKLVVDLIENRVGEKESCQYLVANTVLYTILLYYSVVIGAKLGFLYVIELIIVILISILGLMKTFEINGGESGQQFLVRVNSLSFPLTLKISTLSIALSWVSYFLLPKVITYDTLKTPEKAYEFLIFLWAPVFTFIFYWRLQTHFQAIMSGVKANQEN